MTQLRRRRGRTPTATSQTQFVSHGVRLHGTRDRARAAMSQTELGSDGVRGTKLTMSRVMFDVSRDIFTWVDLVARFSAIFQHDGARRVAMLSASALK
jgi:hypothetical protein